MEMSKNLRQALDHQRLSVSRLAELSGVPRKTIYHWLNGQRPRNVEQLIKVCKVLGVSVEGLFNLTPPSNDNEFIYLNDLKAELNAGTYEVILRPVKQK
jgi:transcriptional regulator with XRE-family HTH domain